MTDAALSPSRASAGANPWLVAAVVVVPTEPILIAWPINVRPGPEADSCAAANFSSWFMLGKPLPRVGAQPTSLASHLGE